MSKQTALLDACVLYPALLRDTLMSLAVAELYRARWTDAIHEEWIRNLLEDRSDLTRERLERTRDRMNIAIEDARVIGYEGIIETLSLPDPDDRHVLAAAIHGQAQVIILAAAIHGQAQVIITFNVKDFPTRVFSGYDIEKSHPDAFVIGLFESQPLDFVAALKIQRERLVRPSHSVDQFLNVLSNVGLQQTVALLRPYAAML